MKRILRDRRMTPEEAEKYNKIRRQVEQEKSEISSRIRARMAEGQGPKTASSDDKTLGHQVRAAREALGRSQSELAADVGISPEHLSQIESDESAPVLSVAARLARALNLSLDELASYTT